jgi:drug/metabolite transporter (DMT)-like permease
VAPLTVVQPALALGLLLLLWLGARWLGEAVRPRDLLAAAAIGAGLALLAWAAPESEHVHASGATLAVVLGGLAVVAAGPWLVRRTPAAVTLILAAGCGFAASGLTSKLLADALAGGPVIAAVGWAVLTAAVAGLGLGNEMAALQRAAAARVAAGAFALQTVVPVVCAPLVTGERWSSTPLHGGVIVAALALVTVGGLELGSAPAVSRLVAGAGTRPE